ncbi:hypothetical protein [Mesorhizobium sp. BR1-1-11]|uniref:hypothetical protein n=1 Tax=Mesorhizobium sp. BR1-1-11 TaxID=2876658 RepID=UPI001CD0FAC0|nr:hypothetical protein [Mesorhizobium sp. BR1-1-11]
MHAAPHYLPLGSRAAAPATAVCRTSRTSRVAILPHPDSRRISTVRTADPAAMSGGPSPRALLSKPAGRKQHMVSIIPVSIAQRRLDTGSAPEYPHRSPVGAAMQGPGEHLSAVAERHQQMKNQQEAFDAELARRRFNSQIAQAEDEGDGKCAGRWQRPV